VPFSVMGAGSPSNTVSPGPRPTSVPSGILISSAVWPQQKWAAVYTAFINCERVGAAVPLSVGELGSHPTQCGLC